MKRRLDLEGLEGRRLMTGATQIGGVAEVPEPGECEVAPVAPEGTTLAFTMKMEGSLSGCFYSFAYTNEAGEYGELSPSGTYRERGIDIYEGSGEEGDSGRFATTYLFTAKFDADFNELWGRCQHPITPDTGTGDFEGARGRLDFRDDVANVTFPYRGHLRYVNPNAADAVHGDSGGASDAILDALLLQTTDPEG